MWYPIAGVVMGSDISPMFLQSLKTRLQDPMCSSEVGRGKQPLPDGLLLMPVAYGA